MTSPTTPSPSRPRTGAAYLGNRFPSHARVDLGQLSEVCDYVVHTVSETDLHFHKAALAEIFADSRRRGLEVWADPWGVGGVFGGESFSKFLLDHPDHWQVRSDGRAVPAACLNSGVFRDFVKEWVSVAAGLGAQVLLWDEPHVYFRWDLEWEGVYACTCATCAALFRRDFGGTLGPSLDERSRSFRRQTLRSFLVEVMAEARRHKLKNGLCLYAFEGYEDYDRIWNELSALANLDIFGCDPYWRWRPREYDPTSHVRHYAAKTATSAAGRGSQVWIQAMKLRSGQEDEIALAVRAAAEGGATHIAAWSYDGGKLLDPVLSEDPTRVWDAVADAFREIRAR
jgi:hypothetical protein